MKIIECVQGTEDWKKARACRVTGTRLESVMGTPIARAALIAELIAEEGTEHLKSVNVSKIMERGTEEEVFAIQTFERRTKKKVARVGLCVSEKRDWHALSPDGLIADKSGKYSEAIEVKCPNSDTAILYKIENMVPMEETGLLSKKGEPLSGAPFIGIPSEYKWQIVNYFLVNEDLKKLHFAVYDARFISDDAKLYVVTIERENEILQAAMAEAEIELDKFRADWMRWKEIVLPTNF